MSFGSTRSNRVRRRVLLPVAVGMAILVTAGLAQAATLPNTAPDDTAMVGGTSALATVSVRAIAQVGNLVWVGGDFNQILDANGSLIQSASDLAVFNATTGAFATGIHLPQVTLSTGESTVYDLSLGPDGKLYFAGDFNAVDGSTRHGAAAIDPTTGALQSFAPAGGNANSILATSNAIYVGAQKLNSFTLSGSATPGYVAPQAFTDPNIRAHTTIPQFRDIQIVGNTLVATCQCDTMNDANGTHQVKAVVEVNAATGNLLTWAPTNLPLGNAPSGSAAFGISVIVRNSTVYLAAGGNDFTAAYDFATGHQVWKEDTSGSSQAITWYQGSLIIGGHFDWTQKPGGPTCNDNQNPGSDPTTCYLSPHLVALDPSNGDPIIDPTTGKPWNPGICCAYNGVWTLLTGNDGTTLHAGGEFTRVGTATWTYTAAGNVYTMTGGVKQQYYARMSGPPSGTQTLNVTESGPGSVTSDTGGINCGTTCTANVATGTVVTLTAAPTAGNNFTGWSGDCSGTATTCQVTMSQGRNVVATFSAPTALLTVAKAGSGNGTISSSPGGINCGATCSAAFPMGAAVTLTETPTGTNVFFGWSGPDAGSCGYATTCQLSMTAARSITATFATPKNLNLTIAGTGGGVVTSVPPGVNCSATCTGVKLALNGTYVLTATPNLGSTFTGWSGADGAGCGTATTCQVTMSVARNLTATFASGLTLTVSAAGTGTGSVTSDPPGINCPGICSGAFSASTNVVLTEVPGTSSSFTGWGGDGASCDTATTCQVTMSQTRSVTATFTLIQHLLTVTPPSNGTITSDAGGVNCGASCVATYANGSTVTLTATPAANYTFDAWTGDCAGNLTNVCQLIMSSDHGAGATFAPAYELSVATGGSGGGTVASDHGGINCSSPSAGTCAASFTPGDSVNLTATADLNSTFTGWTGGPCDGTTTSPCLVTMNQDRAVTANFAAISQALSVTLAGSGNGSVTSDKGAINCPSACSDSYNQGTLVTLSATPSAGSAFSGWSGACSGTGNCQVTMTAPQSVTATFAPAAAACGKILFTSNRTGNSDVFVMNPDGTNPVDLTNNAAVDSTPAWSPNCQQIAFVSTRGGGTDIWLMDANGSDAVPLTSGAGANTDPSWSADGTKLAFASTRSGGNRNLYVMNANGTGVTQLTTDSGTSESYAPSWSPDGTKIAFVSTRTGVAQIYAMAPSPGAAQTKLTQGLAACLAPDWSPDGTKIVFTAKATGTNQVETMSATGTNYAQIVADTKNDTHPSWSPDGTQITYSSNATTGGKIQIFVVNANGSSAHPITNTATTETEPSWSN